MRFAVIADIHANLAALRAVLEAVDAEGDSLESVVAAGDLVGRGPQPNEVLDLLRERSIQAVRGNYDDAVAFERLSSGVDFADREEAEADRRDITWTRMNLTPENLTYLEGLPEDVRLFPIGRGVQVKSNELRKEDIKQGRGLVMRSMLGGLMRTPPKTVKTVRVLHGSPRALNELIRSDTATSILDAVSRQAQADLLLTAHGGEPFVREAAGMTFVGVTGVSGLQSTPGEAGYTVVTVRPEVDVEYRVAPYDASAYQRALAVSGLPSGI